MLGARALPAALPAQCLRAAVVLPLAGPSSSLLSPLPPPSPPLTLNPSDYVGEDYEVFSSWLGTTQ